MSSASRASFIFFYVFVNADCFRWTDPIILTLIILNVIVLTIQATPGLFEPRQPGGYFRQWEDYAIFALFIVFT